MSDLWADAAHVSASSVAARMTPLEKLVVQVGPLAIEEAERVMVERKVKKLPLVDEQGVLAGLVTARDIMKQRTAAVRHARRPRSAPRRGCHRREG